jgi:hypothetical protein
VSNAKKQIPEEKIDLAADREQGLSSNFEDPNLEEFLPDVGAPDGQPSLLAETAEAVQELVLEISPEEAEPFAIEALDEAPESVAAEGLDLPEACAISMPIEAGIDVTAEANTMLAKEESVAAEAAVITRQRMAELFLELVASDMRFSELVESILSVMVEATGAEAGSILELDHEKNEFFFRASRGGGDPEKLKAFRVPASKGIVGHVAETREALFLRDLETDQRQLLAISMSTGLDTKSCLAAAIEIGGQLYGVIELFNKRPESFFEDQDFETLKRGVKMAAKVLEVRFLLAELARKAA